MAAKFSNQLKKGEFFEYLFHCPGCGYAHGIRTAGWPMPPNLTEKQKEWFKNTWSWDGNIEAPNVSPSLNVKGQDDKTVCHSFIENGKIRFLSDSRHKLAGKTVELPDFYFADETDDDDYQDQL